MRRFLTITLLSVGIAIGLISCSSSKKESKVISLHVALAATYVSDENVAGLASHLETGLPKYDDGTTSISVTGISSGDSSTDPMSVMAGSARIASLLASGEIELWICDAENAKRYAENGANYAALDKLFTEGELSSFNGLLITIPITDDEGNSTGKQSEICGLDMSQNATITGLVGIKDPQMFIVTGSAHLDAAKAAFRYLATTTP